MGTSFQFVEYTGTIKKLEIALAGLDNEITDLEYRLYPSKRSVWSAKTWKQKYKQWLYRKEWEYQWKILTESWANTVTSIRAIAWAYTVESRTYPESLYEAARH